MTDQEDVKQAASVTGADDFAVGMTVAVGGLVMFFIWQFYLNFVVLGGEGVYDTCISAVHGRIEKITPSSFPTQIWCETAGDERAGAVYSVWQSVGLSSVTVILVLVMLYGLWLVVRRGTSAPQLEP